MLEAGSISYINDMYSSRGTFLGRLSAVFLISNMELEKCVQQKKFSVLAKQGKGAN